MRLLPLAAAVALVLATCGPKTLALPADPIDRAATCGVIAAVEARAATDDIKASLPFAAQGRIIHYALLAGAEGGSFSTARAAAVNDRMGALEPAIIKGKWQTLLPACRAAFPAAAVSDVRLPSDSLQARLGCDALGDFLVKTINKLSLDHQQKLDAANRQIDGLKANLASLQKIVDDLRAAQKQPADDAKKKADAPAREGTK